MADVIFVAVVCAFFALCIVYIRWCDRIIGPDDATPSRRRRSSLTAWRTSAALPAVGVSA